MTEVDCQWQQEGGGSYTHTACTLSSAPNGNFELKGHEPDINLKLSYPEVYVVYPDTYQGSRE